ncbi:MAG: hypothetical protein QOG57_351 [Pseudonocardiales bacterium]|nr:hypothetical protein [Pseudonocardiales bacterium]
MCDGTAVRPVNGHPGQPDPGQPAGGFGWLAGTWRRTLLVDGTGAEDVSTEVTWLQGARHYLDLRRPPGRPPFDAVRRLRDLGRDQVRWLATQEAFAGELTDSGDHVEWARRIDLHPPARHPDAGTLTEADGLLVERGWYANYVEHWLRVPAAAEPTWSLSLVEIGTGVRASVLRVGASFGWARGRRRELTDPRPLREVVDAAGSLTEAQDAVDVEVSLGAVRDGAWTVAASTLPYREHTALNLSLPADPVAGATVTTREPTAAGQTVSRAWTVTDVEGEVTG